MRKFLTIGLGLAFAMMPTAYAANASSEIAGERPLLNLCDDLGETKAECRCYMDEVKKIYQPSDIAVAGRMVQAFRAGQEPDTIIITALITRQISIQQANTLYRLGDKHADRVGKLCEDRDQVMTEEQIAKRKAMERRVAGVVERYRIGR